MEKTNRIKIDVLNKNDLVSVTEIHMKAFPDSTLTLFGSQALKKYYYWQMNPPNQCHALGAFDGKNLVGYCFAGKFRNAEVYFIQQHFFYFLMRFLVNPRFWINKSIWEKMSIIVQNYIKHYVKKNDKKKIVLVKGDRFGILSIAVDPQLQRSGIGKALLNEVERLANNYGYKKMVLSVHPENQKAVSFYETSGWEKSYLDEDKPWQGYMHKHLQ